MSKNKKSSIEGLFYNNKFLMVFSIIVAVLLWANVKINYSADTTRTISDLKISLANTVSQAEDIEVFFGSEELLAEVEVSGKAYNINQHALTKDDIIVEATGSYVDTAGYKVLTLTAKIADTSAAGDVNITKITPSSITVYFDRKTTGTFNVEAKLENDMDSLVSDEFTVGQPVPSMSTVEVTGPATILNKLTKVYFKAQIDESNLPLTATKEVAAEIAYQLDRASDSKYLTCNSINDESNPATVTIPLYVSKEVGTSVKFVNQPVSYSEEMPKFMVYPSKVNVLYNTKDEEIETLYVGTVDFSNVSNKVNYFEFPVDEKLGVNIVDKTISEFTVSIDMSSMSSVTFNKTPSKIVLLNQDENYNYIIDFEKSELNAITAIGPRESLDKITNEDIQVEINVSSLNLEGSEEQLVEVSNISIASDKIDDCWIYGKYKAYISVEPKE
jgi:hypothetical protein